ncbi:hypothetical protein LLB_3503 [Legionella longbeachae D-4968]|nr:hypothetical protein LLB_3503 [Legionella longbeachae D-4968]
MFFDFSHSLILNQREYWIGIIYNRAFPDPFGLGNSAEEARSVKRCLNQA